MARRLPDGPFCVLVEELPWWRLLARREARRGIPTPRVAPGDLYVQYLGERDVCGNVRFTVFWNEPWATVNDRGIQNGSVRAQCFFCDDRLMFPDWALRFERVILWPQNADVTRFVREMA
jgi:hypothetical protein